MTDIRSTLAGLDTLTKVDLVAAFVALYRRPPLKYMQEGLLRQAVAYRVQEQAAGGKDATLRRRLDRLAHELRSTGKINLGAVPPMKPGTRLLREWQGETHVVTVTDNGFEYRGDIHTSLSKIARVITGTRWSGPAFFGIKGSNGS